MKYQLFSSKLHSCVMKRGNDIDNVINKMTLSADHLSVKAWMEAGPDAPPIQEAFPYFSADEIEFIKTGLTRKMAKDLYGKS